jgi:hypothetical protein
VASETIGRADQVYRTGPEALIAASATILAGPVSNYCKEVLSVTQPPGPDSIPLKWVVSARLESPQVLKGQLPSDPVCFSRSEQLSMTPGDRRRPRWEAIYGVLAPEGRVVLFLEAAPDAAPRAVPTGHGEQDLVALVRDIVPLQAIEDPGQRANAWLSYLERAQSDQARQAALRCLLQERIDWLRLESVLRYMLAGAQLSPNMRAFCFGIVAFGVKEEKWRAKRQLALEFLSWLFCAERNPRLALQYILHLKLILSYSWEEAHCGERQPVRELIIDSLRRRVLAGPLDPELEQQYQDIRENYPGLLLAA